ncbi:hypothetical protein LguiB_000291 [Lonicera macranthoides]
MSTSGYEKDAKSEPSQPPSSLLSHLRRLSPLSDFATLPSFSDVIIDEKVDVIISEWMGYMLLYETQIICYTSILLRGKALSYIASLGQLAIPMASDQPSAMFQHRQLFISRETRENVQKNIQSRS